LVASPPLVGTFHASGRLPTYRTLRPVLRYLARRLAVRVAVSEEALRAARTPLGGEWEVIPNGIDVASHSAAVPWPTESPAILFVGRHEERKGLSVLLEAFSGLRRRAVLWVAGQGPQTSRLRSSSPEGVEWLGRVDDRELRMRMRGASVVCVPSLRGESFGVILLQAMAAGTPVVASDLAGYREVARPGQEALLVPPGDPIALRSALQRVLDGRSLSTSLSRAGALRAEEFSIDRIAASYLELYEATMRKTGPASAP
ncbi:MAG: glycosyltransferase family 4 protein, partial [Acidimicrobiia bacterium]